MVALWGRYPAPRQVRVLNYNDESTNYTDECIPTNCAVGLFIVAPTKHCIRCHSMVLLSVVLALGTCYNAVVAYALAQTSAGVIPLRDKQTGAAEVRSWSAYLAATFDDLYSTCIRLVFDLLLPGEGRRGTPSSVLARAYCTRLRKRMAERK